MPATTDYRHGDGPRDRALRVGDKERDAVGEILKQRHLEGRLDADEFQARLERCIAAKTYAELDELIADFPPEDTDRNRTGRPTRPRLWPPALLFLPLALLAAITLGGHAAWLAVPLVVFFVLRPLAWGALGGGYRRGCGACGPRRTTRT